MTMESQAQAVERSDDRSIADGGQPESTWIEGTELDGPGPERVDSVGGVVFAAGKGERYDGGFKLLEPVDGEPLVRRAIEPFLDSRLYETVLVVGHEAEAVREAVADLDLTIVENEDYEAGQSTSLHRGVDVAQDRGWDGTVFGLGDMPLVDAGTIDLIVQAFLEGHGTIVGPAYDGKRGNPTLFGSDTYDDLLAVSGDTGGRPVLMASSDVAIVETGDPGVLRDVDVTDDLP
jgi:molybdenum cofactor cytidylyltransferase